MYDTSWVDQIDWSKEQTYEDLGALLSALSQSFLGADVSSRTGDFVDGHVKRYAVAKMVELAVIMRKHKEWVHVRPPKNYTAHEGHRKE